jgi:A/G-specific adenine glycosylase
VLARILNLRGDVSEKRVEETIWKHARQLLPKDGCGDFNQALMELGATVCLPRREARCSSCPISSHCKARVAGTVHLLPYKSSKPRIEHETHVVAAICRRGEWLFVRRPPNGLWGGLWELPSTVLNSGDARIAARRLAKRAVTGTMTLERAPFCTVEHQLTHRKIKMVGYLCKASTGRNDGNGNARWLRLDRTNSLALSQAMKRVLTRLAEHIR